MEKKERNVRRRSNAWENEPIVRKRHKIEDTNEIIQEKQPETRNQELRMVRRRRPQKLKEF